MTQNDNAERPSPCEQALRKKFNVPHSSFGIKESYKNGFEEGWQACISYAKENNAEWDAVLSPHPQPAADDVVERVAARMFTEQCVNTDANSAHWQYQPEITKQVWRDKAALSAMPQPVALSEDEVVGVMMGAYISSPSPTMDSSMRAAYRALLAAQGGQAVSPEVAALVEAAKVAKQALAEVRHAQDNGSRWYTKGESGLFQQVRMWLNKAQEPLDKSLQPFTGVKTDDK